MTELRTASDAQALLDRFGGFFDSVLVEIDLLLARPAAGRIAKVRLLAQEASSQDPARRADPEGWRAVELEVKQLTAFTLVEGPATHLVLSDGMRFHFLGDGRCLVDLAPFTDAPVDDEPSLRRSGMFLIGTACAYQVSDTIE